MLELLCQDMGGKLCASVRPYLESAAKSLDLATDFISLEIRIDDLPDSKEPWLHLVRSGDPAEKRVLGTLFCSESCFCKKAPAVGTVFPTAEVWDQALAPKDGLPFDLNLFSESRTEKFLHHELLLARDLVRGLVVPRAIATGQIEAFSAVWAVVIDGRLERLGLPGYSMTERRSSFSRLFACAGVLLPGHWHIFQSLWDGGIADWKDALASIRLLPTL